MADVLAPTPYRVSTITANGSIGAPVDLEAFYDSIVIVDPDEHTGSKESFLIYAEHGHKKRESYGKGFKKSSRSRRVVVRRFDNQVTVVMRMFDLITTSINFVNMKVFRNGNVQLTGLKHVDQGKAAINALVRIMAGLPLPVPEHSSSSPTPTCSYAQDDGQYKIRLINCDFKLGIAINREKMHRLIRNSYNVFATYEPCIYPAVKIQFFFLHSSGDGRCHCATPCSGKRSSPEECKKVTIAVFQSGCVIITGAQTYEQIDAAYVFICGLVKTHVKDVCKPSVNALAASILSLQKLTVTTAAKEKAPQKTSRNRG